jgi:hypothetical protein
MAASERGNIRLLGGCESERLAHCLAQQSVLGIDHGRVTQAPGLGYTLLRL